MHYLISADISASDALLSAVPKIGGKPFHSSYWLVYWTGTAGFACTEIAQYWLRAGCCVPSGGLELPLSCPFSP